jgi:predicted MFS family arabinose efflux permease
VALLVFGVASVGGSTLGGRLTDRFGALPVVAVGLTALTLAMLAVCPTTALSAGWPVLIALAAWGLGGWTFPPSQQHRLIALAPDEASVLLGLNSSAIYAGAAIGGLVGGLVLPAGMALVPAIAAGLAACAIICVAVQHHVPPATSPRNATGDRPLRQATGRQTQGADLPQFPSCVGRCPCGFDLVLGAAQQQRAVR